MTTLSSPPASAGEPGLGPLSDQGHPPTHARIRVGGLGWFFALTYAFSWLMWGTLILLGLQPFAFPGLLLFMLGIFGPSLVGVTLTFLSGTSAERAIFWSRVLSPRRIPAACWAVLFVGFPVLGLLWVPLSDLLGGQRRDLSSAAATLSQPALLLAFLIGELVAGPLGEELGWRGYALDRLLARWTPLRAALGLGVVWALWHLPAFLMPGTTQHEMGLLSSTAALYAIWVVALSVLITWVYLHTGRSVLTAHRAECAERDPRARPRQRSKRPDRGAGARTHAERVDLIRAHLHGGGGCRGDHLAPLVDHDHGHGASRPQSAVTR